MTKKHQKTFELIFEKPDRKDVDWSDFINLLNLSDRPEKDSKIFKKRKCGKSGVKMLKYKGYIGNVEYDSDGKIFTGEIKGLRATLTFQGRTTDEIEESFQQTIDLYLKMCAEDGVSPEKPYSGRFNVRISPELHRDIVLHAASERKSINEWVIETFQKAVR